MTPGVLQISESQFLSNLVRFIILANLCQAEFDSAYRSNVGTSDNMRKKLSYVRYAIEKCYMGDHSDCYEHSSICNDANPWGRPYLPAHNLQSGEVIAPSDDDIEKLRKIINITLGPAAIKQPCMNKTQNKCEAPNRGLSKAIPKHIAFAYYLGRLIDF